MYRVTPQHLPRTKTFFIAFWSAVFRGYLYSFFAASSVLFYKSVPFICLCSRNPFIAY